MLNVYIPFHLIDAEFIVSMILCWLFILYKKQLNGLLKHTTSLEKSEKCLDNVEKASKVNKANQIFLLLIFEKRESENN